MNKLSRVVHLSTLMCNPQLIAGLFLCQASLCVCVLAKLVPPFENSDEFNHMNRVDQIAGGGLIATRYGGRTTSGGEADLGIDRVDAIIAPVRFHAERKVSAEMLRQAGAINWGARAKITFPNTSVYAPFLYLPAVFADLMGKCLGFSITHTLIAARAAGGLASVAAASVAIACAGEAAALLLVLLSLPMSLSLFAAVSQDGPMLAVGAALVALIVRMPGLLPRHGRAGMGALCAGLALLGIGRPAYAPIAIVPLLVGGEARRTATAFVVGVIAVWAGIAACFTMINAEALRGVDPRAQLTGLLAHPGRVPALAWRAMTDRQGMEGLPFYKEFIGVLGWIDLVLPGWFYIFAFSVIGVAVMAQMACPAGALSRRGKFVLSAALLACVGCVFLLEDLTFTPVAFPWIEGVQGRYFLPLALFLPVILPSVRSDKAAYFVRPILLLFPTISIVTTITSVVQRYYIP